MKILVDETLVPIVWIFLIMINDKTIMYKNKHNTPDSIIENQRSDFSLILSIWQGNWDLYLYRKSNEDEGGPDFHTLYRWSHYLYSLSNVHLFTQHRDYSWTCI